MSEDMMNRSYLRDRGRAAKVLYLTSDEAGMNFPNPANITRELESRGHKGERQTDINGVLNQLENQDFVVDRIVSGNDAPYQPTDKGYNFLRDNQELYSSIVEQDDKEII